MLPVDERVDAAVSRLRVAGAVFAFQHGSSVSGGARPDSDVDVAAWWPAEPPSAFEVALPAGVDLLVLNTAPLELAGRIALRGRLIFDDDPPARVRWLATTRKIYADELPRLQRAHADFLAGRAVVDALRLQRLLRGVTDRIAQLRREAGADEARRADPLWLPCVKYLFVTAIEACIDAAQHVCASEGWGPPETNGEAFVLLGRHGALPAELAGRLRQAAGFRNVLVHDYVVVDDGVVAARLADLSDLNDFVSALARLAQEG